MQKKERQLSSTERVLLQQRITKEIRPFIIMMISTAQHPLNIRMEQPVKKTYNAENQLASETTAAGTKTYTYDTFGNVATETREDGKDSLLYL